MSDDARLVTRLLSIGGFVVMVLSAAILEKSLDDASTTGVAWSLLGLVTGALGVAVGVVVLGITLTQSRDEARR
ncbi:hypothetical protein [Aeromicrobium sp. IC_218]|uniref:hypothetical protein n=1 Tax=Aeromicrobium sp. IC_218 TaxID=2545468 RepID=UPI00103A9E0B|nr:hypothetical protein [Aeromicrobium sp. IC_218]TCI98888.1 hypothetical protein E0W78_09050 [Aeromicrobium sp. IC_218]